MRILKLARKKKSSLYALVDSLGSDFYEQAHERIFEQKEGSGDSVKAVIYGSHHLDISDSGRQFTDSMNLLELIHYKMFIAPKLKGKAFVSPYVQDAYQARNISLEAVCDSIKEFEKDVEDVRPDVVSVPASVFENNRERINRLKERFSFTIVVSDDIAETGLTEREKFLSAYDYRFAIEVQNTSREKIMREAIVDAVCGSFYHPSDFETSFCRAFASIRPKSKNQKPLSLQIEEMFPEADGRTIESMISSIDKEFTNVRKTTDKT